MMAQQLSFELPVRQALGRENFFVSPANASAVALIEGWQGWPSRKLILCGRPGSGKTHLTHVWSALSNATVIQADALSQADIPALAKGHVAVEDCPAIAGNAACEEALFHLHNLTLAEGHSLLLTAQTAPRDWALDLPDLASRAQATPTAILHPPDDALLSALIMKHFSDRQLAPTPETIPYLARRIDRSFEAARHVVEQLDQTALLTGRPINRSLAVQVLATLAR